LGTPPLVENLPILGADDAVEPTEEATEAAEGGGGCCQPKSTHRVPVREATAEGFDSTEEASSSSSPQRRLRGREPMVKRKLNTTTKNNSRRH